MTLPYVLQLADRGWRTPAAPTRHWRPGLNVTAGTIVSAPVAEAHGLAHTALADVLA